MLTSHRFGAIMKSDSLTVVRTHCVDALYCLNFSAFEVIKIWNTLVIEMYWGICVPIFIKIGLALGTRGTAYIRWQLRFRVCLYLQSWVQLIAMSGNQCGQTDCGMHCRHSPMATQPCHSPNWKWWLRYIILVRYKITFKRTWSLSNAVCFKYVKYLTTNTAKVGHVTPSRPPLT